MFNAIGVSRVVTAAAVAALGVAFILGVSSPLKAESLTGSEATVTFDRPVEVPGKVLPPGSYVFKTMDNEDLVQVFSADQKHLFATLSVIPEDRPARDDNSDSFVQLNKTRADAPQEVGSLFIAGHTTGFQFVYPSTQVRR
jgi:hypothetical protein